MRPIANALLVFAILVGLMLPNAMARSHKIACHSPGFCAEIPVMDCDQAAPVDHCAPSPACLSDHAEQHDPAPPPPCEDRDCPLPSQDHHHHHHHHHCVCAATGGWLSFESSALALHPPLPGANRAMWEFLSAPESPVDLLERPPNR